MARGTNSLAREIAALNPDIVFCASFTFTLGSVVGTLRKAGYEGRILGPDGMMEQGLADCAGLEAAQGFLALVPGKFTPALGVAWLDRYTAQYGDPGAYTAYGYAAAKVMFAAIDRAAKKRGGLTRAGLRAEIFATRDISTPVGTFSIDANGDTTSRAYSGFEFRGEDFEFTTPRAW